MTIKECIDNGIILDCETKLHRSGEVAIHFYNPETNDADITTFNVMNPLCKDGEQRLNELYKDFCKNEGLPRNTVTEIHILSLREEAV